LPEHIVQVATIARPPMDPTNKKPTTDSTGYIICIYQVFKGDDGEKFERNWLYWTGEAPFNFNPLIVGEYNFPEKLCMKWSCYVNLFRMNSK
jgi:hypothetical protein